MAAIFDPYGNAVHTALSFNLAAEDVLITGAGPTGLMAAAIARHAGARNVVVTDLNDYRLISAKKLGATAVINAGTSDLKKELKVIAKNGFTVGLEMSGSPQGLNTMLEAMLHGGKIALLGLLPPGTAIDWDLVVFNMLTLKGIYGREIFTTWYQMTNLLESGLHIEPVITHRFPIDEFQKGFDIALSGNAGKVILEW